ncbi:hypothetical protein FNV43_RR27234 [Rhamnella rubrinervis]|uniref:Uncharacterized protein n=1 Tax=Rhamnella rubrinervis TaxID=2594499 RepID=A0A8K0DQN4_9ROSA|nr:hypothetical protein FNV43_RR27234 [Rhamnella rubrinervis]
MAKCKLVIGKMPPKDGPHANEKENKAPSLNQVYKPKQVPLQHIKSNTPSVLTTNTFEVLNTEVTPTHIEDIVHQHDVVPTIMTDISTETAIEVHPSAPDLVAAPNRTDFNTETGKSIWTILESDWIPSHHAMVPRQVTLWADAFGDKDDEPHDNDYADDIQSNIMAMVQFDSFGALIAAQRNLDFVASQPSVSQTIDQNLWYLVERKPGRPKKGETARRLQLSTAGLGLTKPFTRASQYTTH